MKTYGPQIKKKQEAAEGNLNARISEYSKYLQFVLTTISIPADGKINITDADNLVSKFKTEKFYKLKTDFTVDDTGANMVVDIAKDVSIMGDISS